MNARGAAAFLAFLLVPLAGCSGDPKAAGAADGGPDGPGDPSLSIEGVVVSPAIVPLSGASVRLEPAGLAQTTDAEGRFAFHGLREGSQTLVASRAGFVAATLALQPGGGIVQVVLEPDPLVGAYVDVYSFDGFIDYSFNVAGGRSGGGGPEYAIGERRPDLIQSEMVWEQTQSFGRWLDITALPKDGNAGVVEDIGHVQGPSPLLLQLGPAAMEAGKLGPQVSLDLAVFAGQEPVAADKGGSVVLSQPYRVITHMFYGYLPPEGWRFTADGAPPPPA